MKLAIIFFLFITVTASLAFDETQIQSPLKNSNEERLSPLICRTIEDRPWQLCSSIIDDREDSYKETPKNFKLLNAGENRIVPRSGFMIGREFIFMFQDLARSDLGLLIWDIPDNNTNHGHLKLMMFFPREVLPAIQHDPLRKIITVTLPNREQVYFDSESKEIIGGVLTEGPIEQDTNGNAVSPLVTYKGPGVTIEAHQLNEYPVGSKNTMAVIKKIGHPNCQVPVKDLWYTDANKSGNVYFNKKYITDKAFDEFLKARCKFSIYN